MPDAAAFQQNFGAALAGLVEVRDPALVRALAVHRNTAARAAQDALADNFPVVRALVGDAAFDAAAHDHVVASPPAEPRLCLYGADFAGFLADYPPFAELGYLADVARVERMAVEALFAADAPAADGAALAGPIDLDRPLTLHPTARFAALTSPAGTIWLAHAPAGNRDSLAQLAWRDELVLVTRPDDALVVTVLPTEAMPFLAACAASRPLGEAAAAVAGCDLAALFSTLIAAGTFRGPLRQDIRR